MNPAALLTGTARRGSAMRLPGHLRHTTTAELSPPNYRDAGQRRDAKEADLHIPCVDVWWQAKRHGSLAIFGQACEQSLPFDQMPAPEENCRGFGSRFGQKFGRCMSVAGPALASTLEEVFDIESQSSQGG